MTNSGDIYRELNVQCAHEHVSGTGAPVHEGIPTKHPPKFIAALLRGFRKHLSRAGIIHALEAGATVEEPDPVEAGGGYGQVYVDEITGTCLPPNLVEDDVKLEIEYMHKLGVYREVTADCCKKRGLKPINTRFLYTNKGDTKHLNIRVRLVAQEMARVTTLLPDESITFAATPPLEALRAMLSLAMTGPMQKSDHEIVLGFFHISRAHFHSRARRLIVVRVPKEDAMYGTKNAAMCFDAECERLMEGMKFQVGKYNPCLYLDSARAIAVFRHGNDFVVAAARSKIQDFKKELSEHLLVKHLGTLGPSEALGDSRSSVSVSFDSLGPTSIRKWARTYRVRERPPPRGDLDFPSWSAYCIERCLDAGRKEPEHLGQLQAQPQRPLCVSQLRHAFGVFGAGPR